MWKAECKLERNIRGDRRWGLIHGGLFITSLALVHFPPISVEQWSIGILPHQVENLIIASLIRTCWLGAVGSNSLFLLSATLYLRSYFMTPLLCCESGPKRTYSL